MRDRLNEFHAVNAAIALAKLAHRGQKDKAGRDYFDHVRRVAVNAESRGRIDDELIVGYLHDIVEDTPVMLSTLRDFGFSEEVLQDVDRLTRRDRESYEDYIERVAEGSTNALRVKISDLEDHLAHPEPLTPEHVNRYEKALQRLRYVKHAYAYGRDR